MIAPSTVAALRRPAVKQAAWLTLTIWSVSCSLFLLPTYFSQGHLAWGVLAHVLILYLSGMLLSSVLFMVADLVRLKRPLHKIPAMIVAVLSASIALAMIDHLASQAIGGEASSDPYAALAKTLGNFIGFTLLFALVAAFMVNLQNMRTVRERDFELAAVREQAARALAQANAAKLAALRYQLNPHLLFNALNAASSLVINHRNAEAEAMLEKLSEFLRTTLVAEPDIEVSLGRELDTIQRYLAVESVRFGERLRVTMQCPEDLEDLLVPSFVLQPLVENAIKYAVAPTREPVSLSIIASRSGEQLTLVVEDSGDRAKAEKVPHGTGLGLENIRQRLAALYADGGRLETLSNPDGFRATLRLPLKSAPAALEAKRP